MECFLLSCGNVILENISYLLKELTQSFYIPPKHQKTCAIYTGVFRGIKYEHWFLAVSDFAFKANPFQANVPILYPLKALKNTILSGSIKW